MHNETTISQWNNPAPKHSFEAQMKEHITKFEPAYHIWRSKTADLEENDGFTDLLKGYILRVCVFDGDFEGAFERMEAFFEEYGWDFLSEWEEAYNSI